MLPNPSLTPSVHSSCSDPISPRLTPDESEQMGEEIAQLAAIEDSARSRLLTRLREFDEREGWSGGFVSCAHWLSWRIGIDRGAARERVRVARALRHLPGIDEGLRSGTLSYSKVRSVTRIATPENEARLVEFALQATAAQLERFVRAWRKVDRAEEAAQEAARHAARYLTVTPDGDGMYDLRGKLDPEVALVLKRALEAASWTLYRAASEARRDTPAAARRADAIGVVAELAFKGGLGADATGAPEAATNAQQHPVTGRSDRYQVVIHADEAGLRADGEGDVVAEDGTRVSAGTSRRLACDARRVVMPTTPTEPCVA